MIQKNKPKYLFLIIFFFKETFLSSHNCLKKIINKKMYIYLYWFLLYCVILFVGLVVLIGFKRKSYPLKLFSEIRKSHNKWIKKLTESFGWSLFCLFVYSKSVRFVFSFVCAYVSSFYWVASMHAQFSDCKPGAKAWEKLSEIMSIWYKVKTMYDFWKSERKFILPCQKWNERQQKRIDRLEEFRFDAVY